MHKSLEVHGHGNQEEFKWSTMIDSEEDDDGDDDYNNHPALKRSPSACRLKKRVAVAVIVEKAAPGGHGTPNENSDGPPASNALGDLYADVDTTSLVESTGTFKCCKPPYVTTGNDKSDRKFYKYLCDLKEFIQEHGHCNVWSSYNIRLYQFCYRTNKNVREPAKVRIEALKAIGFKFKESSPHAHHNDQVLEKAPALVPPFWNRTDDDDDEDDDDDQDQDCMDRKRSVSECDSSNGENGVASIPDSSSKDRDDSAPDENDASNNCDQEAVVETSGVNIRISKRASKQTQFLLNHTSTDASRRKPQPATSTKSTKSKKKRKRNDSNNNDNTTKRNVAELQGAVKYARVQAREDIYGQQDTTNHAMHNVAPLAQSHEHQRGLLKDIIDLENLCFGENYGGHLLQRLARLEGVLLDEHITAPVRAPARIRLLKSKIGSM